MAEKIGATVIIKKTVSDEYKALVRAAQLAKKQAELLGLPYISKSTISDKTSA